MSADLPPIVIECRICGTHIELATDSAETRDQGQDPHQQIRKHLVEHSREDVALFAYAAGFMTSALFFRGLDGRWKKRAHELLDWYLDFGIDERVADIRREAMVGEPPGSRG